VLCQFTDASGRRTLAEYISIPGIYPAGRLDYDSEGLVLLTDDGGLKHRISHPRQRMSKRYLVQVEGAVQARAVAQLEQGVMLKDGWARALSARIVEEPDWLWPRDPPIRQRRHIPTHWLEIELDEGRNRQVRRMTAAVGLPTLRLVRVAVGQLSLDGLLPGQSRQADPSALRGTRPFSRVPGRR